MDLFKGYKGDLLTSKINIHQGAVAICPQDLVCSTHYYLYQINEKKIIPEYLILALRSNSFLQKIIQLKASSIKNEIGPKVFLDFKIYAPDIKEQRRIVDFWHKAKKQAEELSKKAQEQEKEIDDFILRELGVEKKEYEKKKGAFVARFMDLERWDVQFFTGDINLTVKNFVPLRDAIDKFENGKIVPSKGEVYNYIGLENVEKNNGKYDFVECDGSEIKSQSIVLKKGCVYYAKLRPYLNKCFLFKKNEDNFIATSELYGFSVKENIDKNFLLEILLSELIQNQIKDLMIGARMPRISEDSFKNLKIIIPPFPKQKQIAEKVEKMRAEIQEMKNISDETLEQAKNKIGAMLKV
jgi:restriction endonuclease S subunit